MTTSEQRAKAPAAGTPPVEPIEHRLIDPRAVRVSAGSGRADDPEPIIVEPPAVPLAPATHLGGHGVLGGIVSTAEAGPAESGGTGPDGLLGPAPGSTAAPEFVLVDGEPRRVRLRRLDAVRAVLVDGDGDDDRIPVSILEPADAGRPRDNPGGTVRREVLVDGWRVEVEIEPERRASLRARARRGSAASHSGGPTEVRAIIPGRIVSVSVGPGDAVEAGQQLLVVEAMKMQNELRAPRDGTIDAVAVGPGDTIEVRDLLLVLR